MHESVLFARAALRGIVCGRGPVKDANGIDGGTGILHRLGRRNSARGDVTFESVAASRRWDPYAQRRRPFGRFGAYHAGNAGPAPAGRNGRQISFDEIDCYFRGIGIY